MEFLIFLTGFVLGAAAIYILFVISKKNEQSAKEAMLEQMKLYFENTANNVIKDSSKTLTEQNSEKLEEFFKRFKDKIEGFEKLAKENLDLEAEKFTRFDMNIRSFLEAGNKISQDTNSLVNVMKSDNRAQGHWGEIVLEKVLESAELRRGEEYDIQKGAVEGRPDATINLPEGKLVFVDAKTSFSSWYGYVNSEDESEKQVYLKQFKDSTKSHINGLVKRGYWQDDASPDFVLMFIPIEGCYSMMFCDDCDLWKYAWEHNVYPVSPSTLLAALRIINSFFVVDRQNKNAIEISRLCSGMLDKFSSMLAELLKIRTNLDTTLKKLNGTGNIINQIKKIEKLGGVGSKQIPELPAELVEEEV